MRTSHGLWRISVELQKLPEFGDIDSARIDAMFISEEKEAVFEVIPEVLLMFH